MAGRTAPLPGVRAGGGAVRRWAAPGVQAVVLTLVLLADLLLVAAARADLRAEAGQGPVVAVPAVQRGASPPVTLGIPDLGITTRLIGLRKERTGALQVPADPQRAGWYSQGPAPGDAGPAVLVGHVDSYRGPGIFARVRTLKPGAEIRVRRADGSLAVFEVRQVQEYAKRDFPTQVVYGGDGRASLRLVTCGGEFDRRSRSYRSNVVVFAALKSG
jgi:hypothetical protein